MPKFRKKPVVIEAVQYSMTQPFEPGPAWLNEALAKRPGEVGAIWSDDEDARVLMIGTLESPHECRVGDWIIQGVAGELYPCKPDVFAATYEPA